jgi:methylated-DNA-[protein]-cysteine S-methyltransferase
MNDYRFFVERVPTPTGMMLLVTDEQERLRALDWEDHEVRMHRLLRLHYGVGRTRLEANAGVSNGAARSRPIMAARSPPSTSYT